MITFADLEDARVGLLAAAAEEWQRVADRYAALSADTTGTLTRPIRQSGWAGDAAAAATARLEILDDEFEVAASRARMAAVVLRRAVEDITDLQRRLRGVVDGAVAAGLSVTDDGRVIPPFMSTAEQSTPEGRTVSERNAANAGVYADLLWKILVEAGEGDTRIALALESICGVGKLPAGQHAGEYNDVTKAARSAAAALGLTEDAIPAAGTDPAAVKAWWDGLSTDERQLYAAAWPEKVGGLDGLPATDRDTANRQALRNYIGDNISGGDTYRNAPHDRAVYLLQRLEGEGEHDTGPAPMYLLGFDPDDDGQAIVAFGNPDTAAHTAVVVPGVGTELDEYYKELRRAQILQEAGTAAGKGEPVSVITWLGYDTPGGGLTGIDIVTAPFGGKSEAGARALDTFVDGLRASHDDSPSHITGIGHSYGSTVFGEAASTGDGIAVDDIIVAGSPGMRVDYASELNTGTEHTWATAAVDDSFVARPEKLQEKLYPEIGEIPVGPGPVVLFGEGLEAVHGPAPHNPEFGAKVLQADTSGHSGYWKDPKEQVTDILKAQAAVIVGDYERAEALGKVPAR
ncbi:alpha/beta hydrolase [Actinoplanes utahensis]|uniref:DUF1023 domain-containing protein n=1 Tax=Actinoplanes utahensis TaxID=1869 RepID=A0A0A6XCR0_ACTUT|nr:alpha/beta hydrolase [Actinoplanes utahensis]KHD77827.1 hypothetical protein MB27_08515 [Actinoplanes utahensis]GIF32503.1 hypothetical protein Aut01nite_54890 [Actinoplanes utahensis]